MTFILFCAAMVASFYGGILLGIANCKRRFNIPKGAVGVTENGYVYS